MKKFYETVIKALFVAEAALLPFYRLDQDLCRFTETLYQKQPTVWRDEIVWPGTEASERLLEGFENLEKGEKK